MKKSLSIFFSLMFWSTIIYGQLRVIDQELVMRMEHATSDERIRLLSNYQERTAANIPSQTELDLLFVELNRMARTDPKFERYFDFIKRVSPTMFIPEVNHELTHRKMIELLDEAAIHYTAIGNDLYAGISRVHAGFDSFMLREYEQSIENMYRGYEFLKKYGFDKNPLAPKYLHDMALVFIFFRDYERVVELMEESILIQPIDLNRDLQRFNNLGMAYEAIGKKMNAEETYKQLIKRAEFHKVDIWKALALSKVAGLRLDGGYVNEALAYYEQALALINSETNPREFSEIALKVAKISILQGNFATGLKYISMIDSLAFEFTNYFGEQQQFEKFHALYYEVNQLYYRSVEDYEIAYRYADSLYAINRVRDSIYNVLRVYLTAEKIAVQKSSAEKEHLVRRIELVVVFSVVSMLVLGVLYYSNRLKRTKEKIVFQSEELRLKEEQQRLTSELTILKSEMENHLEKIAQNNRLIREYRKQAHNSEECRISIDNIKILTKEHWESFVRDFKDVHNKFYRKITKSHPDLTPSELRMILLLKLGLTPKDLPAVLGTSDGNIRVTLHRIKKKLGKNDSILHDKELYELLYK